MKKIILSFVMGLIIAGSIGVYATIRIQATDVEYNGKKLNTVLDDLYMTSKTDKICKYKSNDYGSEKNVGSEYVCDVNLDGQTKYNFYILKTTGETVTLIMKQNITQGTNKTTYTRAEAVNYINSMNWKIKADLPKAQDIADAVNNTTWRAETATGYFCMGLKDKNSCSQGGWSYASEEAKTAVAPYRWLFNYTNECTNFGCDEATSLSSSEAIGYWTRDLSIYLENGKITAFNVQKSGNLHMNPADTNGKFGVRPVITVLKSNLY